MTVEQRLARPWWLRLAAAMFALILALPLHAQGFAGQGFAGLGSDAQGFALPRPGKPFDFPADHGPHPDFRIEWWYFTATLSDAEGRQYGIQWTLFRLALQPYQAPGWNSPQMWMGHGAVTTADRHFVAERLARGGIGQAGVVAGEVAGLAAAPFKAWIDDWTLSGTSDLSQLSVGARGAEFAYALELKATGPLVLHGAGGYSVKSATGQASHYYSQPSYTVSGVLTLPGGPVEVTGQGWLDREWSSQPLAGDQTGWDWFSLSFDSGARMMGFRLRGSGQPFTSATWIDADGTSLSLPDGALQLEPLAYTPVEGREIPVRWRVVLAGQGLDIEVSALNPASWMNTLFPYWEGPVSVSGSHTGRGYLEMTGYD